LNCLKNLIWRDRDDLFKILIRHRLDIDLKNEEGDTLLVKAVSYEKIKLIELLIESGVDVQPLNQKIQKIRFFIAGNHYETPLILWTLIDRSLDVNAQASSGMNLLIYSIRYGKIEIIIIKIKRKSILCE